MPRFHATSREQAACLACQSLADCTTDTSEFEFLTRTTAAQSQISSVASILFHGGSVAEEPARPLNSLKSGHVAVLVRISSFVGAEAKHSGKVDGAARPQRDAPIIFYLTARRL